MSWAHQSVSKKMIGVLVRFTVFLKLARVYLVTLGCLNLLFLSPSHAQDWRTADRSPLGIAPLPSQEKRAVVQIYVARAFAWRGYFAVHPWIAFKEANAESFSVYEVVRFRRQGETSVVRKTDRPPDSRWFGNDPDLIFDLRGPAAEKMIPDIVKAIQSYPYPTSYRLWPGPNSNTFVSHVIRNTPGISIELPPHAIGRDWLGKGDFISRSESGTGFQISLFGLLGMTLGLGEGIEINILSMTFGIDVLRPALKLPFIGRIGFRDQPVFEAIEQSEIESQSVLEKSNSFGIPNTLIN